MFKFLFGLCAALGFLLAVAFTEGGSTWIALAIPADVTPGIAFALVAVLLGGAAIKLRPEIKRIGREVCDFILEIQAEIEYAERKQRYQERNRQIAEHDNADMVFCIYHVRATNTSRRTLPRRPRKLRHAH